MILSVPLAPLLYLGLDLGDGWALTVTTECGHATKYSLV